MNTTPETMRFCVDAGTTRKAGGWMDIATTYAGAAGAPLQSACVFVMLIKEISSLLTMMQQEK
ncbi:hypothetical protein [Megalodesulfovibrio gigas]|uniref:hypothetical protein n=1 Tax=Megalodesulfovibrio gigas TaxID=879 RepID=UPI001185EFD3|nr:hypothetical protein [Megalodesulfovibrio gigas]